MIKRSARINIHGQRSQIIDKNLDNKFFLLCLEKEKLEYVMLCESIKSKWHEWTLKLHVQLCKMESYKHLDGDEEKKIEEMINAIKRYFNKETEFVTNQNLIGFKKYLEFLQQKSGPSIRQLKLIILLSIIDWLLRYVSNSMLNVGEIDATWCVSRIRSNNLC